MVDCRKIEEGKLGFFRVGIVPKSRVQEIFDSVQERLREKKVKGRTGSTSSSNTSSADSGLDDQSQGTSAQGSQKGSRKSSRKLSLRGSRRGSQKGKVTSRIEGTVNPAFVDDDDRDDQDDDKIIVHGHGNPDPEPTTPVSAKSGLLSSDDQSYNTFSENNSGIQVGPRRIRRRDSTSGESDVIDRESHSSGSEEPAIISVEGLPEVQVQVHRSVINQEDATSAL